MDIKTQRYLSLGLAALNVAGTIGMFVSLIKEAPKAQVQLNLLPKDAKKSTKADEFRGDIVALDENVDLILHIECKNAKTCRLPAWFAQAEGDAPKGRIPCVIFHKHGTSKDYIALSLEDFFRIVPKDSIIKRRGR